MERRILVLAGPSAVGKTSIAEDILSKSGEYVFIRSATTRKSRDDAYRDEYIYMSKEEFLKISQNGGFLEFMEYGSEFYGTPRGEIDSAFEKGKIPLLILDINGVRTLKESGANLSVFAVYIYDRIDVIESRLYKREMLKKESAADNISSFEKRKAANIRDFKILPEISSLFDYFVKNEGISFSGEQINRIFKENSKMSKAECKKIAKMLSDSVL